MLGIRGRQILDSSNDARGLFYVRRAFKIRLLDLMTFKVLWNSCKSDLQQERERNNHMFRGYIIPSTCWNMRDIKVSA